MSQWTTDESNQEDRVERLLSSYVTTADVVVALERTGLLNLEKEKEVKDPDE